MKKRFKYFTMATVVILTMSTCNKEIDEQISVTKGKAVSFQMGLASTRTSTGTDYVTTFVKGDAVGIFAYERNSDGTEGALEVTNAKYILNEAGTTWEAADANNTIYADSKKAFNYYAYYPYKEGATNPGSVAMAVKLDQSTANAADYNVSDVLTARNKTVAINSTSVSLQFTHAFAMVQVNLEGVMADKDATITMQNVFPEASLNLQYADKTLATGDANGTKGSVKMYSLPEVNQVSDAERFVFRAIIPAQQIAANDALLEIQSKGKTYRFTYSTAVDYAAGKIRVMNVMLGESSIKTTITIPATNMGVNIWGTTEDGTGMGTAEEVPLISKFGTELTAVENDPTSLTTDSWFALKLKTATNITTASLVDDSSVTWGKAAKLEFTSTSAQGNSWYVSTLGYYHTKPVDVSATTIYKVTLKLKAEHNGSAVAKHVFTCRNAANNASFQASANADLSGNVATTVTKGLAIKDTWETFTFYINFAQKSTTVGSTALSASEATDYSKFDLRVYTSTAKSTPEKDITDVIYISDVVIEPYTVPVP